MSSGDDPAESHGLLGAPILSRDRYFPAGVAAGGAGGAAAGGRGSGAPRPVAGEPSRRRKSNRSGSRKSGSLPSRLSDAVNSPGFPTIEARPGAKKRFFRTTFPPPAPAKSTPWQSPPPCLTAFR